MLRRRAAPSVTRRWDCYQPEPDGAREGGRRADQARTCWRETAPQLSAVVSASVPTAAGACFRLAKSSTTALASGGKAVVDDTPMERTAASNGGLRYSACGAAEGGCQQGAGAENCRESHFGCARAREREIAPRAGGRRTRGRGYRSLARGAFSDLQQGVEVACAALVPQPHEAATTQTTTRAAAALWVHAEPSACQTTRRASGAGVKEGRGEHAAATGGS